MTVVDSSAVVDYLIGGPCCVPVERTITREGELAAPDVIVFEVLAALRRIALGGLLDDERATDAVMDLGALPLSLFPSTPLRGRAWELRRNVAMADALFAALAERLAEPLLTGDRRLCNAIATRLELDVSVELAAGD